MLWLVGIAIALVLFFVFPRQMGAILLFLVVGVVLIFLYLQNQSNERADRIAQVQINASFDRDRCSNPEFPVLVSVFNGADKTITRTTFYLQAFQPGYSNSRYSRYTTTDRIIGPRETFSTCWSLDSRQIASLNIAELDWRATSPSISFR